MRAVAMGTIVTALPGTGHVRVRLSKDAPLLSVGDTVYLDVPDPQVHFHDRWRSIWDETELEVKADMKAEADRREAAKKKPAVESPAPDPSKAIRAVEDVVRANKRSNRIAWWVVVGCSVLALIRPALALYEWLGY